MSYNFSDSKLISAEASSLMGGSERGAFDSFVASYGYLGAQPCPFCGNQPRRFYHETIFTIPNTPSEDGWKDTNLLLCPSCLWFRSSSSFMTGNADIFATQHYSSYQERTSDLSALPLERLQEHLARQWEDRKELTPGRAEELVAEIFKEHMDGEIHYTTNGVYAPDGGIDFVLVETSTGLKYAFQVKRRLTDKPERVQAIREFIGAMAVQGYDQGYFVTFAPRVTKDAEQEMSVGKARLDQKRVSIHLVDGTKLRDILRNSRSAHLRDHCLLAGLPDFAVPGSEVWHEIPLDTTTIAVPKTLFRGHLLSLRSILASV